MITILHTTGYPTVTRDGHRLSFNTRFDLALLLYLALSPGVHGRDTLAKLLWPAVDRERALNALRSSLSRLRLDYGQWLCIDRCTVSLIPDSSFVVDNDGYALIGDGLRISLQYDAWLRTVRCLPDDVRPLPYWWIGKAKTEISGVADFCRDNLDRYIFRHDNTREIENRYSDIFCAFLVAKDPGDQFVLGAMLFYYALAGHHARQTYGALLNLQSDNEMMEVGRRFAMIALSDQHASPCDYADKLCSIDSIAHGNADPLVKVCHNQADSIVSLHEGNATRAAEIIETSLIASLEQAFVLIARSTDESLLALAATKPVDTGPAQERLFGLLLEMDQVTDERKRAITAFINQKAITETEFSEQMKRLDGRLASLTSSIEKAKQWVTEEQEKNESMLRLRELRSTGIATFAKRHADPGMVNQWLRSSVKVTVKKRRKNSRRRATVQFR